MEVHDELVYSAISSNRNEKNISCRDGYLLYSKCRCPILYNLSSEQLAACLTGHTDEVNGQSFVDCLETTEADNGERELHVISTAHDNSAIIWRVANLNKQPNVDPTRRANIIYQIKSPDDSIFQTRCSLKLQQDQGFLSVLTTIDGNVYLCKNDQVIQTIATQNCYFDAKFFSTPYYDPISGEQQQHVYQFLSLAGSDNKVHVYLVHNHETLVHLIDLAGFSDWIKCLDFLPLAGRRNEFLLATACQDSLVQVWHMELTTLKVDEATRVRTNVSKFLCNDNEQSEVCLTATLETVLSGHESFVYSLCWFKSSSKEDPNLLQLISCSADRTIIIWQSTIAEQRQPEPSAAKYEQRPASEGVWKQLVQLGETGEANLPFLGVCLARDERTIFAQSYRGAIHAWTKRAADGNAESHRASWEPRHSITGHFEPVTDIIWARTPAAYLLTASLDKTCRLHGVVRAAPDKWHELARPQVHGFEINCLAPLNAIKFASGAEEKTIRTFEATQFFVKNFEALTGAQLLPLTDCCNDDGDQPLTLDDLPAHAQLPALGLSNRGAQFAFDVYEGEDRASDSKPTKGNLNGQGATTTTTTIDSNKIAKTMNLSDNNSWHEVSELAKRLAAADHLEAVPHEEILLQSTLWWEKNKLFGHCNELHALASTSSGHFLASASKANRPDLASVILWDTAKFRKVATLEHHTLTITRLRFAPDDSHLLSVSRDRTWCLFERNPSGQLRNAYRKLIGTSKTSAVHERIIWDCCWTCDARSFFTVSRDRKAIVWSLEQLKRLAQQPQLDDVSAAIQASKLFDRPIQAVDSPLETLGGGGLRAPAYLVALGFEDGSLELHALSASAPPAAAAAAQLEWRALRRFESLHQLTIRRLAFKPPERTTHQGGASESGAGFLLASGGDDCVVRLTRLRISGAPA